MKIRCGSHQQNRSIVRPGLSLMAAKVALTAEEFRENSQRSIDLFNTEKLSTDSTRVLKSVYCNSVHFCRCNLHGACGGKGDDGAPHSGSRRRCNLHGACGGKVPLTARNQRTATVAICTERVEAKRRVRLNSAPSTALQSARSVWRQRRYCKPVDQEFRCNLHGACGGKGLHGAQRIRKAIVAICTERVEAKVVKMIAEKVKKVAICTERVEAKEIDFFFSRDFSGVAICTERVEAKLPVLAQRGRQRVAICTERVEAKTNLKKNSAKSCVAICTERVEAKGNETAFATFLSGCNLHGACGGKVRCRQHPMNPLWLQSARSVWRQSARHPRLSRHTRRCNLHGACGGKGRPSSRNRDYLSLQSARSVWRQRSPAGGVGVLCSCCNLHGACGGKAVVRRSFSCPFRLQSARSVWRQSSVSVTLAAYSRALQSARSVWRQSSSKFTKVRQGANVAICTERVEAKVRRFAYAHLCRVAICTERVEAKRAALGDGIIVKKLQSARSVWRQSH